MELLIPPLRIVVVAVSKLVTDYHESFHGFIHSLQSDMMD
jgi:hypothetical protein